MPSPAGTPAVRRARPGDAPEVVRLAELMYRTLGADQTDEAWAQWRRAAVEAVTTRLGHDIEIMVADGPDGPGGPGGSGRLVACGAGMVSERMPNPWHAVARVGYVQWMSTEPAFRRRGLGRAVLRGLLDWFEAAGIDNVELHASPDGAPLYRAEGFWAGSAGVAMRRRPWDPPPAP